MSNEATGRWIVNMYDAADNLVSSGDFETKAEAEHCFTEIEEIAVAAGGSVELVPPGGEKA